MKNLKLLVIAAALVIGISSCKKDEKSVNNNATIVGSWLFKKDVRKNYRNGVIFDESTKTDFTLEDYIEFKSDGKGAFYVKDGNNYPFTYTITNDGKKITMNDEGDLDTYDIITLNDTELVLYLESTYNFDGANQKYTEEKTLKRK